MRVSLLVVCDDVVADPTAIGDNRQVLALQPVLQLLQQGLGPRLLLGIARQQFVGYRQRAVAGDVQPEFDLPLVHLAIAIAGPHQLRLAARIGEGHMGQVPVQDRRVNGILLQHGGDHGGVNLLGLPRHRL